MGSRSAEELVAEYLEWRKRRTEATDQTMHSLRHVLSNWLKVDTDQLAPTDGDLVDFAYRSRRTGEPSKYRIKNDLNVLRSFYDWAYRYEHLPKDYGLRLRDAVPKISERLKRHVPLENFYSLPHAEFRDELRFCLGLGWFGGLRANEMARLKTEHVQNDRLLVQRKRTKRGTDHQSLPWVAVGEFLAEKHEECGHDAWHVWLAYKELMLRSESRGGYLIPQGRGEPESTRRLQTFFWNPAGFVYSGKNESSLPFTPHDLRHSFGHNLFQAGLPIERVAGLMNHATSATTQKYYVDMSDGLEEDLKERMSA
tara:strand:- start:377 stop:1309 length:933 start_codon:yes stop_codon:yes gene_type:complete